jgi:hypothetical protein
VAGLDDILKALPIDDIAARLGVEPSEALDDPGVAAPAQPDETRVSSATRNPAPTVLAGPLSRRAESAAWISRLARAGILAVVHLFSRSHPKRPSSNSSTSRSGGGFGCVGKTPQCFAVRRTLSSDLPSA